jgi:serine/threonine protein kinase
MPQPSFQSPSQKFELIRHLQSCNHYQRLSLKSSSVTRNEIDEAWAARQQLLQDVLESGEITTDTFRSALELIHEAYRTLSDDEKRRRYDVRLARASNSATLVPEDEGNSSDNQGSLQDQYKIETVISDGPRAKVSLARDRKFQRPVVIKQIHASQLRSPSMQKRFQEEAQFFAASNATNLVKVYDYEPNSFEIVMEWLPDSVNMLVERVKLKKGNSGGYLQGLSILRQALCGLNVLHSRDWVHGRICGSHILLDDQGNAKLSITPGLRDSETLSVPGTSTNHIAPELLNPSVFGPASARSDLYALGFVILDLLCCGELQQRVLPSAAEDSINQDRWFRWHASTSEQLPPLDEILPGCPPFLITVLSKLTRKRSDERPANAQEALMLIEELSCAANVGPANHRPAASFVADDTSTLLDFGAPPRLPSPQYELSNSDTNTLLSHSLHKLKTMSRQQKLLIAASVVATCCLLLIANANQPVPNTAVPAKEQEPVEGEQIAFESNEADTEDEQFQPLPWSEDIATTGAPVSVEEIPSTTVTPPSPEPPEHSILKTSEPTKCWVYIEALPNVEFQGIEGQIPSDASPHAWQLLAGKYQIKYTQPGADGTHEQLTQTLIINESQEFLKVTVGKLHPVVSSSPSSTENKVETREFRTDFAFDFISRNAPSEAESARIKQILERLFDRTGLTILEKRKAPLDLSTIPLAFRRDPRISYLLAVEGYVIGEEEKAIELCRESISLIEEEKLPFYLPYHLLIHIQAKLGGRSQQMLSTAVKAVRHAETVTTHSSSPETAAQLAEQLWFFGNVLQHVADQSRITSQDLNYWQRIGLELESRFQLKNQPTQSGRNDYLGNLGQQIRSPLRFDPTLLIERVRQTFSQPSPQITRTAQR